MPLSSSIPTFEGPADLDGVFSGLDAEGRVYDKTTWAYQTDADGIPLKDETLQDPRLRVPVAEKAVRALHARVGFGHNWHRRGYPEKGL